MREPIIIHEDSNIGLTMGAQNVRFVANHGLGAWIATEQIGSIFGAEVHGEIQGIGATREQALQRLVEERIRLGDSLWA